jgi:serine/alanine adding enzyme
MLVITNPDSIDRFSWNGFILNHPNGSIFQSPEMYDVFRNTKNYEPVFLAVTDDSGILRSLLLAVIQKEHSGLLGLLSARAIITYGPLVLSDSDESLELLLKEYDSIIRRNVIYSQIRNFKSSITIGNTLTVNGFKRVDHLNIIQNLNIGEDELWRNLSKSRKKGIKKALSEDFSFDFGQSEPCIAEFHKLLSQTYKRIRLPFPGLGHFFEIGKSFTEDHFGVFFIRRESIPIAALFVLIFKDTMYGYYMGATGDPSEMKNKPIDLLFWLVFKWAIERNIAYFDWMGAGKPNEDYGVRDFKLQYGGTPVNVGRYEKIHKRTLYSIATAGLYIWRGRKK